MAQNVTVAGASYSDVPSVELPKTGGGTAEFFDTTDANATTSDIAYGKTAYVNGSKLSGTGAAVITSTYNSSTKTVTLDTDDVSCAWFGSLNPEFVYETSYTIKLNECTDYTTKIQNAIDGTSAQTLTQPKSGYSTAAATTIIFDRYGSDYHSGSRLDFRYNDYVVLNDTIVDTVYTSSEASLGVAHTLHLYYTSIQHIGQAWRLSNDAPLYPDDTNYGTATSLNAGYYIIVYRTAAGALTRAVSASYGVYCAPQTPTFASTSSLYSNYINFRSSTFNLRTSSTYMASTAWSSVDVAKTQLRNRHRLYKVRKPNVLEEALNRMGSMFTTGTFPTEVI